MIRFFAAHPTAANLLMIGLLAMGMTSLPKLIRETMPDFSVGLVEVRTVYPGASAEDVEEAVCARIEDAVDGIQGVAEVTSEAREGVGVVVVEMAEGSDLQPFLAEVKREVDAIDNLPELAEAPIVRELGWTDLVVSIAISGKDIAEPDLKAYCEDIKDRLREATGVRLIEIQGFSQHQLRVELFADALQRYGLSAADVADIVSGQSVDIPAGTITSDEREMLVRFTDERRTPLELASLVIVSSVEGGEVLLGDVANIEDVFELEEERILVNGERAALLEIQKTKAQDSLNILGRVKEFVADEEQRKPPGVTFTLTQDVASVVSDRLWMLVENGAQGLALVFVVLALFFSLRLAFWVTMGIPVAFLGALFFLEATGYTINMITMVGLLMAIGLLMDDAIVLAENVAAHRQRGSSPLDSVVDGVLEVRVGVLSSFLTTVSVFGPLAFVSGDIGKVLRVMPIVLILVLAVSLVEAFLILPNHLSHALGHIDPNARSRFRTAFESGLAALRERVLGRLVDWSVRWRYLAVGLLFLAFAGSLAMLAGGVLKVQAFPDVDGDVVEARILMPQGTPLAQTEQVVERMIEALGRVDAEFAPRQPDGAPLVRSVMAVYNANPDAYEVGPHVARIVVDLLSAERRDAMVDDVLRRWREETGEVAGALALTFIEPAYGPAGRAIEVRLIGDDLEELKAASLDLGGWFEGFDGVVNLSDDLRPGKPEFRLSLREGASALGLTARGVASELRSTYLGSIAREFQRGRESYEVDVRMAADDRSRITDLERMFVTLADGAKVPLPAVARFDEGRGYARIARVDGRRAVTLTGDVDTSRLNTAELMTALREDFAPGFAERHPGVRLSLEGEAKESATTQSSMVSAALIGLLGVFLILSFQFRSYVEPLIVMAAIPMCLIGVVWGHLIMGLDLTMPSIFGLISLAGVVVNDSILLVEFVKKGRRRGLDTPSAASLASRERFRAVLLTSLTTILGLVPLMFERSLQAQFLVPLAASIVFGLLASTVLVLVGLPALYSVIADFGWAERLDESSPEPA